MKMLLKIHELLISLQKVKEIGESQKGFYLLIVLIPLCEDLFLRMWAIVSPAHPYTHTVHLLDMPSRGIAYKLLFVVILARPGHWRECRLKAPS